MRYRDLCYLGIQCTEGVAPASGKLQTGFWLTKMRRRFPDEAATVRENVTSISMYSSSRVFIERNSAPVETHPYPKSQNSPFKSDIAVSDILRKSIHLRRRISALRIPRDDQAVSIFDLYLSCAPGRTLDNE